MAMVAAALPLLPGKGEEWRRWAQELQGSRHAEYAASRNRLCMEWSLSLYIWKSMTARRYVQGWPVPRIHLIVGIGKSCKSYTAWISPNTIEVCSLRMPSSGLHLVLATALKKAEHQYQGCKKLTHRLSIH